MSHDSGPIDFIIINCNRLFILFYNIGLLATRKHRIAQRLSSATSIIDCWTMKSAKYVAKHYILRYFVDSAQNSASTESRTS